MLINIIYPLDEYDINVTPNKRTILIHNEDEFVSQLRDELMSFCEPYRNVVSTSGINYQSSASKTASNNLAASLRSLSLFKSSLGHSEDLAEVKEDTSILDILKPSPTKTPKSVNQTIDSVFKRVEKRDFSLSHG